MILQLLKFGKDFSRPLFTQTRSLYIHIQALGCLRGMSVWTQSSIFRRRFELTLTPPHSSVPVTLRIGTSDLEVYKKIFIDEEYALPFDSQPATIIDLGANTGLATLFFLSRYPSAKVLSVEPDHENFAMLQHNVGKLSNVICIEAAVWNHDGQIHLIDPGIGSWGMQVTDTPNAQSPKDIVSSICLPSLLSLFSSTHADLMKVDIEGTEKEVFEDSASWISSISSIVIELHDRYKPGCSRAFFSAVTAFPNEKWVGENVFVWR